MSDEQSVILLSDTNVAYKLYFFLDKEIVPREVISIPNLGRIEFHEIVKREVSAHIEAWQYGESQSPKIRMRGVPKFFNFVGAEFLFKILEFVECNKTQLPSIDRNHTEFVSSRKAYERERLLLQKHWKASGTKGNKTWSCPSNEDYLILHCAQKHGAKILTNDEILLAISEEVLEPDHSLKIEDVLNIVLKNDPKKRQGVTDVIETLAAMSEVIITSRVFQDVP